MYKSTTLAAAILAIVCTTAGAQTPTASPAQQHRFDIPASDLASALERLVKQTGVDLVYRPEQARSFSTDGANGTLTTQDAIRTLLHGTPLQLNIDNATGAMLIAAPLEGDRPQEGTPTTKQGREAEHGDKQDAKAGRQTNETGASPSKGNRTTRVRAAGDAASNVTEIDTIVVTAQKREQRLADTPLSVSVLYPEDMTRRGLIDRGDYLRSIPSVNLREDGPGQSEIVIRGAYGDAFRTGPTVGLYINDVPLSGFILGGSTDIKLIDIERVEILRGPQGTLYGSNALSGAIKYVTASPDPGALYTDFDLGYSHTGKSGGNNYLVQSVVNIPVASDVLAFRASAFQRTGSGYVRGVAGDDPAMQELAARFGATELARNKDRLGDSESWGVRLGLRWIPSADSDIDLTYMRQVDSQDDRLFELRKDGPYRRSDFALANIVGGPGNALRTDIDLLNLRAQYDMGWATLYSSTAKMKQWYIRKFEIGTLFGSPVHPVSQTSTTDADIFSQELRLTSELDGPIQFIGGLYYEDSDQPTQQPTFFGGNPALNPYADVRLYQFNLDRIVRQKAAFGELAYEPIQDLILTVGARAFHYSSRFVTISPHSVVPFVVPSVSDISTKESGQIYKARAEYKPSQNTLVYGTFSQGFRLGRPLATDLIRGICDLDNDGFLDGTDISSRLDRVDSDRLDSYEAGGKMSVLGGRGSIGAAIYQNDWKDLPIAFQPPGCLTNTTINGGTARARGVEIEGNFSLRGGFRTNFGVGYVDSELTSSTSLGQKGDRLNFTPELNASVGIEYNFNLLGSDAFIRGDYTYFDTYYTQTGERGIRADSYGLVNLSAGVALTTGLRLQLNIDNALGSDAFTSVLGPSGFPAGYGVRLRPRTIGVRIGYSFW